MRASTEGTEVKTGLTLTQLQEQTIQEMMESRSSERRAAHHRGAVIRKYRKEAQKLGYTAEQTALQVVDVWDMYRLRTDATEEHRGWL